jgi:hypothetical protein
MKLMFPRLLKNLNNIKMILLDAQILNRVHKMNIINFI